MKEIILRGLLYLSAGLVITATIVCNGPSVVRDEAVYQTELDFMEQAALQPSVYLEDFIQKYCKCENDTFTTSECTDAARVVLTVKARVPYHKAMALYNAGLLKNRPSKEPPEVPGVEILCRKQIP